ncbi:MAG TPA: L,D-transpeptidase family protein [Labilithrix sp.]|jgi:murein L,D-transpeptidase YafK|nr:L,D-transpeptidase family protein [Labilithrix sp.]
MLHGSVPTRFLVALAAVVTAAIGYPRLARGTETVACGGERHAFLLVDVSKHSMALCESGKPANTFRVRLGKHGVGKSREGDGKTPLGWYGLSDSIRSASYGRFIPIGYPTAEQRRLGYTGGAVGVHGPDRRLRWMGALVNVFDTTDGCIGLATDDEMAKVARWVHDRRATAILIR